MLLGGLIVKYYAKEGKGFWLLLLLIVIANIILLEERIKYSSYMLIVIILLAMFLKYEFTLEEDKVQFRMKLFSLNIRTRQAAKDDIKEMIFIKLKNQPSVLIKLHKGFRIKLANFMPETYVKALYEFAKKHQIQVSTIGDFKELEKNEENSQISQND